MIDKTYQSAMQGICKEDLPEVGYDLWLSDGKNLLPVVLHPSLHKLVTSGELALFSIIQVFIGSCKIYFVALPTY